MRLYLLTHGCKYIVHAFRTKVCVFDRTKKIYKYTVLADKGITLTTKNDINTFDYK